MTHEVLIKARSGEFKIVETEGDVFEAPQNAVLIHAVNCQGAWGAGIAEAFKSKYPAAFEIYKSHCRENSDLPGTCLLIPPRAEDYQSSLGEEVESAARQKRRKVNTKVSTKRHWIGCLFTSLGYGRPTKFKPGRDSPEKILSNTRTALKDLREQVEVLDVRRHDPALGDLADKTNGMDETSGKGRSEDRTVDEDPDNAEPKVDANLGPLYACKFNSGSFGVEWNDTRVLIEDAFDGSSRTIHVAPQAVGRTSNLLVLAVMSDPESTESPHKKIKLSTHLDGSYVPPGPLTPYSPIHAQTQKELDVGITHFVSQHTRAFSGVLKKRYTDFLVNEILPNGEVLHLRSMQPPRAKANSSGDQLTPPVQSARSLSTTEHSVEPPVDGSGQLARAENSNLGASHVKHTDETSVEISVEDSALLRQYFSDTDMAELLSLYQKILASPNAKSRDLGTVIATVTSDRSIRTKIHHDVRRIFNSKIESSTDKDGAMILSAAIPSNRRPANQPGRYDNQRGRGKLGWEDRGGEYLHFTIYKENKDTMEVISFLARQMKANVKIFQFAGTKDRRGVTVQRASAHRVEAERLAGQNRMLRNACVGDFEYQKHGLELGDLKGNEFVITLRDCKWDDHENLTLTKKLTETEEAVSKSLRDLHERGYFNYYGLQRFGTFSTRTDTIGLKILQGDFKGAVEAILQYSPESLAAAQDAESTELISSEDKARAHAIHVFQSTGKVGEALEKLPRKYSAESNIIRHLGRHRDDYAGALQMIQRNMKLMYVHAYQSIVWNFAVGERWRVFGDKVVEGDLVMVNEHKEKAGTAIIDDVDADGEVVIQPAGDDRAHDIDDVFERARPLTAEEATSGAYSIFDVVLPQPGFDVIYGNMSDFYKTFMASECGGGLDPLDMRRKQRDYSLSGSYRKMLARITAGYEFQVKAYSNDDEQFVETDLARIQAGAVGADSSLIVPGKEVEGDKIAVILKLQLGSSQYATMALRELMKGGLSAYKPDFGASR